MMDQDYPMVAAREVAKIIGHCLDPLRVYDLIHLMNLEGFLCHGVSRWDKAQLVMQEGIKPLSPEMGGISQWKTGSAVFWDGTTYDTPFFHYAHSYSQEPCISRMVLVAARHRDLCGAGVDACAYMPNHQMNLRDAVPLGLLTILNVNITHEAVPNTRQTAAYAEKLLFDELEMVVRSSSHGDYQPGSVHRMTSDLHQGIMPKI